MKRGVSGTQVINSGVERDKKLLLGKYLAKGESMLLYAPTGQGKTVNALMLGVALSTGGQFYDWKAHKPCNVLFVEGGELSMSGIAERLRGVYKRLNIEEDDRFHLKAPTTKEPFTFNITDPSHQKVIVEYIQEYQIECVIFDNYNSLRLEEDSEFQAWQRLEKMLNKLKTMGCASVIIHHTNKEGRQQSGAQRKADFCDLVLRIQKSRLSTRKDAFGPARTYVEVEMQKFRWGEAAPTILTELIFNEEGIDLVPADYEEVLERTVKRDLNEFGLGYVRRKFDYLGYKLDHYMKFDKEIESIKRQLAS